MIKPLACIVKDLAHHCPRHFYLRETDENAARQSYLLKLQAYYKKVREEIDKIKSFIDLLDYKVVIPEYNFESYIEVSRRDCRLHYISCGQSLNNCLTTGEAISEEIKTVERKLASISSVLKHLKIRKNREYSPLSDDIIFKFYDDKDENVVCVFFDVSDFKVDALNFIYLSFGENIHPMSRLIFSRHDKECLRIIDIFSDREDKHHASKLLSFLVDLIPYINENIIHRNKKLFVELNQFDTWEDFQNSYYYKGIIKVIDGVIHAEDHRKRERLVYFYKKNNFYKAGALYREV